MLDKIEGLLRELFTCLQSAKMYGTDHALFQKELDKGYLVFQDALSARDEIIIGIVGEELAFEKEVLFDLSKMLNPTIIYLKERSIERLSFYRGLSRDELEKFVVFISGKKEESGVDPQTQLSLLGIRNISVGKLKTTDETIAQAAQESIKKLSLYDDSAKNVSAALDNALNLEKIDHLSLKSSINNIVENLSGKNNDILKLATLKRYSLETYTHMLNVSIIAMHFSSRLGFDKEEVLNIGIAALFHDIGKLYISRKVLNKKDKLGEQEFDQIRSHTLLGAEMMLKYIDSLGILPVVVTFEHHLKYDLTGYPKLPYVRKPHIVSSIVSICDVYDALSQRRGYKQDYSPDIVYSIMNKDKGSAFEPNLLDRFFRIIGVWPIGAIVSLDNGMVAVVRDENESDILRPKVEIIYPRENREAVDLLKRQELKVQRYLDPWKEGKEFLPLANNQA